MRNLPLKFRKKLQLNLDLHMGFKIFEKLGFDVIIFLVLEKGEI